MNTGFAQTQIIKTLYTPLNINQGTRVNNAAHAHIPTVMNCLHEKVIIPPIPCSSVSSCCSLVSRSHDTLYDHQHSHHLLAYNGTVVGSLLRR